MSNNTILDAQVNIRDIAAQYRQWNLNTIPPVKDKKNPCGIWDANEERYVWKEFQIRFSTVTEWDKWVAKGLTRIGVVCGKISGNLLVLDFDQGGKAFDAFKAKILPELWARLVIERTPSGGVHIFVRSKEPVGGNETLAYEPDVDNEGKWNKLIETRGEGGFCVCAPSQGYMLIQGSFGNISVLESAEIELLLDAARSFNQKPPQPIATPRLVVSPVSPADMAEAERRAIAYINAMPEAIEGCNGSADALRVCNKLHDFGLDQDTAKRIFVDHFNPRCVPEWSDKEIDHKLDAAYNKPLKPAGCMLGSPLSPASSAIAPTVWQPFPLETLPWTFGDFVKDVSSSIGIDSAHVAISALAILSGLIGRTFVLEVKPGHREYAMLWCALVAPSGFGKSPPLHFASKPIRQLQREAHKAYKKAYAEYKELASQHKSASAQNQSASATPSAAPTEPARLRYIVSQPTTEALLLVLAENSCGLTLVRDELAGFLKGMDRYNQGGKGDVQIFIEIHGGHPISVDRKTGVQYLAVDTPSLAIIGGVQTEVLRSIIKRDPEFLTTGFGARFLMAFPPAEPIFWNDHTADPAVLSSYEGLINQILDYRGYLTPDNPGVVKLSPEAWTLIRDFQNQQANETLSESNGGVISALNKAGMHCARIALNLHVIEHAARGGIVPSYEHVSEDTMRKAIALTTWFLNEAFRVYAMFDGTGVSDNRAAMKVEAKIRQLGGRVTLRELHSGIALFRGMKADAVKNSLQAMVDAGVLSIQTEMAKNGREVEYYTLSTLSTLNTISTIPERSGGVSSIGSAGVGVDGVSSPDGEEGVKMALSVDSADSVDKVDSADDGGGAK